MKLTDNSMDASIRYQYHQSVYVLNEMIEWFNKEAPPDDVGLLFEELIDAIRSRVVEDDIKPSFVRNNQLVITMPYTLKTVARQVDVKIICRFVKVIVPFSPNINFIGYISFGKTAEMKNFLKQNERNMRGHNIIDLPHPSQT